MRFLIVEEVELAFMLIDGAETGRINRRALTDWVVRPLTDWASMLIVFMLINFSYMYHLHLNLVPCKCISLIQ